MAKLTINDTEYYTEDFNEQQLSLYNQVLLARDEMQRIEMHFKALEGMSNALAGQIVDAASAEEPEDG